MPVVLDGDALAARYRSDIKARAQQSAFVRAGGRPGLTTILVGDDPASRAYVSRKHADCEELGFASQQIDLPAGITQRALLDAVDHFNRNPASHGLLVQFPLPPQLDQFAIQERISPEKDVDGLHPVNLGRMIADQPGLRPCTPNAIVKLLQAYDVPLAGRKVAIIGRGHLVGRPLSIMISAPGIDAVPTVLHTAAGDLAATLRDSDVIISAAGQPDLVRADMVKPGACVVGVGISYIDGQMVSDIAGDVADVAGFITPRHGSVGATTRAMLMSNLLDAALASA